MASLTQFSMPALLSPVINKMVDEASAILLLICSHEGLSQGTMIGLRPCAYASAYVDPKSQSYDISTSTSTRRTKLSVFLVLILPSFHLVMCLCLCLCLCLCASENQA